MELSETVEFAYRRRYNLPPTDPRFLRATPEQMLVDYWAHRHCDDPKLRDEEFNPDFDDDLAALEAETAAAGAGEWDEVIDERYEAGK